MEVDSFQNEPTPACPQCETHLEEIARLRAELAAFQQTQSAQLSGQWWSWALVVVLVLNLLSQLPPILVKLLQGFDIDTDLLADGYILLGAMIGVPWAHWSLMGIFCMLLEGSTWKRLFIFLGLCAIAGATTLVRVTLLDIEDDEIFQIAYAAPVLTIVIAAPTFFAKAAKRWIVAQRDSTAKARPTSISTYMVAMTTICIAITAMKFLPSRELFSNVEQTVTYTLIFGGTVIGVAFIQLLLLPLILRDNAKTKRPFVIGLLTTALLLLLIYIAGSFSSYYGFAAYCMFDERNIDWSHAKWLATAAASILVSATLHVGIGCFLLRALNYQLRSSTTR